MEEQFSQGPERNNVVHDLLAFLAEQMMEIHERKQQAVEDFWLDVRDIVTDGDTHETLRTRGKWEQQTLYRAVPACRPFVAEDSRSTRHLDESPNWNEKCFVGFVGQLAGSVDNMAGIVRVHRRYAGGIQQLNARIAGTDSLIDQILYRLYGLSEEEIAIMAGEMTN